MLPFTMTKPRSVNEALLAARRGAATSLAERHLST